GCGADVANVRVVFDTCDVINSAAHARGTYAAKDKTLEHGITRPIDRRRRRTWYLSCARRRRLGRSRGLRSDGILGPHRPRSQSYRHHGQRADCGQQTTHLTSRTTRLFHWGISFRSKLCLENREGTHSKKTANNAMTRGLRIWLQASFP